MSNAIAVFVGQMLAYGGGAAVVAYARSRPYQRSRRGIATNVNGEGRAVCWSRRADTVTPYVDEHARVRPFASATKRASKVERSNHRKR